MKRLFFIPLVLIVTAASAYAAKPAVPIHAWWSIPSEYTSAERYQELAGAGFTTRMSPMPDLDAVEKALDAAKGTGVKLFVTCPELGRDP